MKEGYVYLVQDALSIFTKIGKTKDLKKRLDTIQACNPISVNYKKIYKFSSELNAHRFEKLLHATFKQKNVRLEWFAELNQKDYNKIDKLYDEALQGLSDTHNQS